MTYSETLLDHCQDPRNVGEVEDADAVGAAGSPGQGRYLQLSMRLENGRVVAARHRSYGCSVTLACGSMLTEMIVGRTLSDCRKITANDLAAALDGLPPHRADCAAFALGALESVLEHVGSALADTVS